MLVLGADHPNTLDGRNNLAGAYWTARRRPEAIETMEVAVQLASRSLSESHEVMRALMANLRDLRGATAANTSWRRRVRKRR